MDVAPEAGAVAETGVAPEAGALRETDVAPETRRVPEAGTVCSVAVRRGCVLGAVDGEVRSGNTARPVGQQKRHHPGSPPPERPALRSEAPCCHESRVRLGVLPAHPVPAPARDEHRSGGDGVHPDSVRPQFTGERGGQLDLGGLRHPVLDGAAPASSRRSTRSPRRDPPPAARRCGTAARTRRAAWPTFTSQVAAQSSASVSSKRPPREPPAQATTPSSPPKRFAMAATNSSRRSGSVTSSAWVNSGESSDAASAARSPAPRAQVATRTFGREQPHDLFAQTPRSTGDQDALAAHPRPPGGIAWAHRRPAPAHVPHLIEHTSHATTCLQPDNPDTPWSAGGRALLAARAAIEHIPHRAAMKEDR